jgi:thioredoxin 1
MGLTTHVVRGRQASRLLVLAHGLGADERDLSQLVAHLDPEGHFLAVLPRGPYSAPPGFAWFHFGDETLTSSTMRSSLDALDQAVDDACRSNGLSRADGVIGGFSQGCVLALGLGLGAGRTKPAGILGMSGFLPDGVPIDLSDAPPVLLQHGTNDPLIPVSRGRETAEALAADGVPVVYREYPMQHEVTLEGVRDAKAWLDRVRNGERPSEPLPEAPQEDGGLVRSVSAREFEVEVLRSAQPVIVDFWAPWCQPCRMVAPVVEQIAAMRKGSYKVVKVNIDEAQELAERYQIQSIPLVAMFRNGRLERRCVGAKPRPQMEAELGMLVIP